MIVRCDHLRLIGILSGECCPDCHGSAGCVGEHLPGGHQIIYCCARIDPLTAEEAGVILAHIPEWEKRMSSARYTQSLRSFLTEYQEKLNEAKEQGWSQQTIRKHQCAIKRFEQLLYDTTKSAEN